MKRMTVLLWAVAMMAGTEAKTLYVNCNFKDYAGHDGSTPDLAYETIQEAVDAAATSGDTILVAPGEYKKGGGDFPRKADSTTAGNARVAIIDKSVTLKSTGNRNDTFIVGQFADTDTGVGEGAYRCVSVCNGNGTIIEGFTLKDGSTAVGSGEYDCNSMAGGLLCWNSQVKVYLVDCDIRHCTAKRFGASYYGTLVRCRIAECPLQGGVQTARFTRLYCSIVAGNYGNSAGNVLSHCKAINCTITGNYVAGYAIDGNGTSGCYIYNSIVETSGKIEPTVPNANNVMAEVLNTSTPWYYCGYQLIAPACWDFRVKAGSAAETAGDAQYLTYFSDLPSEYVGKDFNGNAIVAKDNTIMAGAIQESVAASGDGIFFDSNEFIIGDRISVNGGWKACAKCTYMFPTKAGETYKIEAAANDSQWNLYYVSRPSFHPIYPDSKNVMYMMGANGDGTKVTTNTIYYVSTVVWADPEADASVADGSYEKPYRTLQAAVESKSTTRKIIKAKAGTYAEGKAYVSWPAYGRVVFSGYPCRIIGVEGAEKTFIVGEPDPEALDDATEPGCSTNAVCCVLARSEAQVCGCTLTGGYGDKGTDTNGGGFRSSSYLCLTECVISNNVSHQAGAGIGGDLYRCLVADNLSYGNYALVKSVVSSSVLKGNTHADGGSFNGECKVLNSTIISDSDTDVLNNSTQMLRANNIFVGGVKAYAAPSRAVCAGNVYWNFGTYADESGVKGDPEFIGEGPRVTARSAAVGAAVSADGFGEDYAAYWWSDYNDVEAQIENGAPLVAGAVSQTEKAVYVNVENGGVAITGGSVGANPVSEIETLTISVAEGTRPVCGLVVNGVTNSFEDLSGHVWSADAASVASSDNGFTVDAIYSTDWYVSPDGNDSALGYFPACAKKTLAGALTNRYVAADDTVHALKGVYNEGETLHSDDARAKAMGYSYVLKSRAVVPARVTLVADFGPEETVIEGREASASLDAGSPDWKFGADALRCVFLNSGAKVKGFTLRGGRTRCDEVMSDRHFFCDNSGGGVCGVIESYFSDQFVEDCVISNCAAFRGGAMRYVSAVNCKMFHNYAHYNSAISGESSLYGCIADHNRSGDQNYGYKGVYNCTFGSDNLAANGNEVEILSGASGIGNAYNTLVLGKVAPTTRTDRGFYYNCYCTSVSAETSGLTVKTLEELAVDEDYRPVIGANAAIDGGDETRIPANYPHKSASNKFALDATLDAGGGQRVYNGTLDAGALEADWRPVYAADLRKRGFEVVGATKNVMETDVKAVKLANGDMLNGQLAGNAGGFVVRVQANGEGTLSIVWNGEVVDTVTGSQSREITLTDSLALNEIAFAYNGGEGYGEVTSITRNNGFKVIIR